MIDGFCVVMINSWHIWHCITNLTEGDRSVVDQHHITEMAGTTAARPPPPPYEKCQAQSLPPVTVTSSMFPSPSFGREPVRTVCRNCHSNVNYPNHCNSSIAMCVFRSARWSQRRQGPWPGSLLEFSALSPAAVLPGSLSSYQISG